MPQDSGGRNRDYRESDMRVLLREKGPFHGWDEAADWLKWARQIDGPFPPDLADQMRDDLWWLEHDGVPYTDDPGEAYRLARSHRPSRTAKKNAGLMETRGHPAAMPPLSTRKKKD